MSCFIIDFNALDYNVNKEKNQSTMKFWLLKFDCKNCPFPKLTVDIYASIMEEYDLTARLNPIPDPSSFVVKNGTNI